MAAKPDSGNGISETQASEAMEGLPGLLDDMDDDAPPAGDTKDTDDDDSLLDDPDKPAGDSDEDEELDEDEGDAESDGDTDDPKPQGKTSKAALPEKFTVTTDDGKDVEVTKEELARGILLQRGFTQKTTAHAEEVRTFKAEVDKFNAEYKPLLDSLHDMLVGEKEPDWVKLENEDPIGFATQKIKWQERREMLAATKAERKRLDDEKDGEFKKQILDHTAAEYGRLIEVLPAWKDDTVRTKQQAVLSKGLARRGFTPDEIRTVIDHRMVLLALDAERYVQMKGKKTTVVRSIPSKTSKPGAGKEVNKGSAVQARKRLRETGRESDAAAAILRGGFLKDMDT